MSKVKSSIKKKTLVERLCGKQKVHEKISLKHILDRKQARKKNWSTKDGGPVIIHWNVTNPVFTPFNQVFNVPRLGCTWLLFF